MVRGHTWPGERVQDRQHIKVMTRARGVCLGKGGMSETQYGTLYR